MVTLLLFGAVMRLRRGPAAYENAQVRNRLKVLLIYSAIAVVLNLVYTQVLVVALQRKSLVFV